MVKDKVIEKVFAGGYLDCKPRDKDKNILEGEALQNRLKEHEESCKKMGR